MEEKVKTFHKCVLCNRILESKESLQEHFRKHANREIDSKGTPSKTKAAKKFIKKDAATVKKGKASIIACDVCGQEFTNNTSAIQHKFKKHPDVSVKYVCPYCGMQFTIKALFDNHIKTHSSDTRKKNSILCKECGAEFYFEGAKEYHYKSTHERVKTLFQPVPTPPPSKKIKMNIAGEIQSVYYCHLCGSEYVVKFNLQKHLEKTHTKEERCVSYVLDNYNIMLNSYLEMIDTNICGEKIQVVPNDLIRCTVCDALFYNRKAYDTHNMSHKSDDLYVTSEQQRLQTVSRVDQDFDIRRVLPFADKYLPTYKLKPKLRCEPDIKAEEEPQEELSPPSTPDSTDSEMDAEIPLANLKGNSEKSEANLNEISKAKCEATEG